MARSIQELKALTAEAFEALGKFRSEIYGFPVRKALKQDESIEDDLKVKWRDLKYELDGLLEKEQAKVEKEENKRLREEKAKLKAELKLNPPPKIVKVKVVVTKKSTPKVELKAKTPKLLVKEKSRPTGKASKVTVKTKGTVKEASLPANKKSTKKLSVAPKAPAKVKKTVKVNVKQKAKVASKKTTTVKKK